MALFFCSALGIFPVFLLLAAVFPSRLLSLDGGGVRRLVCWLAGAQCAIALIGATAISTGFLPPRQRVLELPSGLSFSVLYDGVAGLMLALVSFVGLVICRYSIRYLDGEQAETRYYRWVAVTIGSVSLMVVSGNLLMFLVAWFMTSLGLHQLLLHYADRPAARRAAMSKFAVSRIGDAALIAALTLIYSQFKTLDFASLYLLAASVETTPVSLHLASFFLVVGAITKSAQFPFHTWLPLTMETPTPVSAFMHAGIVNAGGYLIIRTSPLVALSPWAMSILALIGGFTACFAATVMLTQTSIKKSLAYSTIAQMGFMLLQCGLGAFSAAMLHILAHSLYKAHEFLNSGSVLSGPAVHRTRGRVSFVRVAASGILFLGILVLSFQLLGISLFAKPGGLLLGAIIVLALLHWMIQAMQLGDSAFTLRALGISSLLCGAYAMAFYFTDVAIRSSSLPEVSPQYSWLVSGMVLLFFVGLFALQANLGSRQHGGLLTRIYIHVSNGFYIESILRRVLGPLRYS